METLIVQTGGRPGLSRELVNHNGEAIGIGDGLIRVSVGLEGTDDLLDDFRHALEAATSA